MARIDDAVLPHPAREGGHGPHGRRGARSWPTARLHASFGSPEHRDVARARGAPVAGAAEEREQGAAAREDGEAHPRRRAERGRHGQAVRRLDHHWQGKRGAITTGGTTILAVAQGGGAGGARSRSPRTAGRRGRRRRRWWWWRDALRRVPGRPRATSSLARRTRPRSRTLKKAGVPVVRGRDLGPAADPGRRARPGGRGRGRLAARHRRRRAWPTCCFGDYKPTGKLSFTWPRSMAQIPINVGDANVRPAVRVRVRPDVLDNNRNGRSRSRSRGRAGTERATVGNVVGFGR